jgi:hypothetical protein
MDKLQQSPLKLCEMTLHLLIFVGNDIWPILTIVKKMTLLPLFFER